MDSHQIWVERDGQSQLLGSKPQYGLGELARWAGLRIGRFEVRTETASARAWGAHPMITLMLRGQARSAARVGNGQLRGQHRVGDLTVYAGNEELRQTSWRAEPGTAILAVELDRTQLQLLDGDDRLAGRPLHSHWRLRDAELAALLQAMWQEVAAGSPHGRLYAESLSLGLARQVFRRFGPATGDDDARGRLASATLARVEACLRERLAEPLGLADLAEAAGLSRSHFARLYRRTTGQTPYQRLLGLRLEKAAHLLRQGRLPLAEVALACGFSSQSHLGDACRRHFGCAPGQLRGRARA